MENEHDPRCPAHTSGYVECECNTILRTQLAEAKAEVCRKEHCLLKQIDRATKAEADNARLRNALENLCISATAAKSALCQGHSSHWDSKGTHGANCPACIENGRAVDDLRKVIAAADSILADTPEATQ